MVNLLLCLLQGPWKRLPMTINFTLNLSGPVSSLIDFQLHRGKPIEITTTQSIERYFSVLERKIHTKLSQWLNWITSIRGTDDPDTYTTYYWCYVNSKTADTFPNGIRFQELFIPLHDPLILLQKSNMLFKRF